MISFSYVFFKEDDRNREESHVFYVIRRYNLS